MFYSISKKKYFELYFGAWTQLKALLYCQIYRRTRIILNFEPIMGFLLRKLNFFQEKFNFGDFFSRKMKVRESPSDFDGFYFYSCIIRPSVIYSRGAQWGRKLFDLILGGQTITVSYKAQYHLRGLHSSFRLLKIRNQQCVRPQF